ncbi:MAG: aminotransferase class III-fold pyridoxal phosphate-dependent enzyme [Myxococcota bacterium]|nr:aminotransferase class III-fold pyridoxal phosphate-dependent enzyme [Myxococcota bacterium]
MNQPTRPIDLDALEVLHSREENAEARRNPIDNPRRMRIDATPHGQLVASSAWLDRLYAGHRMAKEKKPNVFDHVRSAGPWMTSVDDQPLVVLDGMSQTATLTDGFASDAVVRGYFDGAFNGSILSAPDTSCVWSAAAEAYAVALRDAFPSTPHVAFTNSGAEANEKALALCKLNAPSGATKVLAFEGSFHGRTLQSLHATWNPVKRTPYELPGFHAQFVAFPVVPVGYDRTQTESVAFRQCVSQGNMAGLKALAEDSADDQLRAEVASLDSINTHLASGSFYAVMVEPMQSEGGDRYGSYRFFRARRLLTRHHGVALIIDEVQTGFGLGGLKAWSDAYGLVDAKGDPDAPDATTWAKRAQVGLCLSRFEDPEPTSANVTSLVRGRLHLTGLDDGHLACEVEGWVSRHLSALTTLYGDLVGRPRGQGYAFAFDLPTPQHMLAYIKQRFQRGAVVFAAGTKTIRYRLSSAYGEHEVRKLFGTIRATLDWLTTHPDLDGPMPDGVHAQQPPEAPPWRIRTVIRSEAATLLERLLEIEAAVYEPARRDSPATLNVGLSHPDGVAVVAEVADGDGWMIIGSALAGPLEQFESVEGPDTDRHLGQANTAYSIAITVHPDHQGQGVGKALRDAQLKALRTMERSDGPRYEYVTGRNRVGLATSMTHVNRCFGAYEVVRLTEQYGEKNAEAIYYRQPLRAWAPPAVPPSTSNVLPWSDGIARPWHTAPASLRSLLTRGALFGPTVNKITICNYVTPAIVRAIEWVGALNPNHPHLYLTSCRDELVDKSIRTLKHNRPSATLAIGVDGGYLGHTTSGARALSDPAVHRMGAPIVEWPRMPHPSVAGTDASIDALKAIIEAQGGPDAILGIFVEPFQERTGHTLDESFWESLSAIRNETGIPLVSIETASAGYRCQAQPFATDGSHIIPDIRAWWPGGQTGFIHLTEQYFVEKPLTMVSTWDGDEISLIRCHHNLRALRLGAHDHAYAIFEPVVDAVRALGYTARGTGLYALFEAGESAEAIANNLQQRGLAVRSFPNGMIALVPPFDITTADADRAIDILQTTLPTRSGDGSRARL